jgi:uncharacterized heparinase superfamily protein
VELMHDGYLYAFGRLQEKRIELRADRPVSAGRYRLWIISHSGPRSYPVSQAIDIP